VAGQIPDKKPTWTPATLLAPPKQGAAGRGGETIAAEFIRENNRNDQRPKPRKQRLVTE